MGKSAKKKTKDAISSKKPRKIAGRKGKASEYVNCLMELHKLQGVLLTQLYKEI